MCCFRISSTLNQQQKVESPFRVYLYFFSISVYIVLNKIQPVCLLNIINLAQHNVDFQFSSLSRQAIW